MKTIVICSSAAFYEHANQLAAELKAQGFTVVVPKTATKMQESGDYDVAAVKTWYDNPEKFEVKTGLMREHFSEVANGDSILVINDTKHSIDGYIGPNVLMEMGLAFYLEKPIFVLNAIAKDMPVYEEILGMNVIFLGGNLKRMTVND